ncbi:hypothetical protein ACPPVV_10755 [Rhodanobacter sp. Col0626]|uniref:hypothetical protein n=1 Tax=Rhodanobacter sp. Col0626 TaxID=3415679 RepID=UPI003CF05D01
MAVLIHQMQRPTDPLQLRNRGPETKGQLEMAGFDGPLIFSARMPGLFASPAPMPVANEFARKCARPAMTSGRGWLVTFDLPSALHASMPRQEGATCLDAFRRQPLSALPGTCPERLP